MEINGVEFPYVFQTDPVPGAASYQFFFTADNYYSKDDPGITFSPITKTEPFLVLSETQWQSLTPCKYSWYVKPNNAPPTPAQSFLKIKMYPATNYGLIYKNVLLLHGWISNHEIWEDVEDHFATEGNYATWNIDYPNTGHIAELAAVIPKSINYIKSKSTNPDKINIVAHSMGGLLARSYINGIATTTSGQVIDFNDDIERVALLGTPNKGSRYKEFLDALPSALILKLGDYEQYAAYEMQENSSFLNQLNQIPTPASVGIISFAGDDTDLGGVWGTLLGLLAPHVKTAIKLILNGMGPNDGIVSIYSATYDLLIPYRLVDRNHLDIYKDNFFGNNDVMPDILNYFNTGQFESDDIGQKGFFYFFGNSFKNVFLPTEDTQSVSGGYVEAINQTDGRTYFTPLASDGDFKFSYLLPADYELQIAVPGYVEQSAQFLIPDSTAVIHHNFYVEEDSLYAGVTNYSILINNGALSTNSNLLTLDLNAENASEMIIPEEIGSPLALLQQWLSIALPLGKY
jgi:triacylglycerol esterase/lipase EstA (alpha/beta hydrolase family)